MKASGTTRGKAGIVAGPRGREERITIRLTPDELAAIEHRAERAQKTVSDYIRHRALGKPMHDHAPDVIIEHLRFAGVMLQRLAQNPHAPKEEIEKVLERVREAIRELA